MFPANRFWKGRWLHCPLFRDSGWCPLQRRGSWLHFQSLWIWNNWWCLHLRRMSWLSCCFLVRPCHLHWWSLAELRCCWQLRESPERRWVCIHLSRWCRYQSYRRQSWWGCICRCQFRQFVSFLLRWGQFWQNPLIRQLLYRCDSEHRIRCKAC